jgi:hypothetical protein
MGGGGRSERDFISEGRNRILLLEGSQAVLARPDKDRMSEDVRVVSTEILITVMAEFLFS